MARKTVSLGSVFVTDDIRRLFNVYHGRTGLATNAEIRDYIRGNGTIAFDTAIQEAREDEKRPPCPWPDGTCNHTGPDKLSNHREISK